MYGIDKKVIDPRKPLQIGKINKGGQGERIYSIDAAGITLSAYGGGAAAKTGAYLIDGKVRKLTPRECARMQGYSDEFILPDKKNIAFKQFGDSVSVPVLEAIMERIKITCPALLSSKAEVSEPEVKANINQLSLVSSHAE
jgi:site-specific DNA-cytosine methylase